MEYYNLDAIISIGYRVKSQKGVRFRQWVTSVLKNYIQNGYVINSDKITNERFVSLENDIISQTTTPNLYSHKPFSIELQNLISRKLKWSKK
jgi:hypothetical protein